TLVECHAHGKCKLDVLHYFSGGTDFSKINWCAYVVNCIKKCKLGWTRNTKSPFRGAITILMLLYVDSIECTGMIIDSSIRAIEFWSVDRLKKREGLEIENGGFGFGDYVGMSDCGDVMVKI
ncbi:hypothetical protein R6Q57_022713, partial [Mikania cordata]